jgi:hypothetical protein
VVPSWILPVSTHGYPQPTESVHRLRMEPSRSDAQTCLNNVVSATGVTKRRTGPEDDNGLLRVRAVRPTALRGSHHQYSKESCSSDSVVRNPLMHTADLRSVPTPRITDR